jgi:hypothetical protein
MPLAEDQQQVGDLDPRGEHKPFRVSIRTAAAELVRTGAGLAFPPPSAVPAATARSCGRWSLAAAPSSAHRRSARMEYDLCRQGRESGDGGVDGR